MKTFSIVYALFAGILFGAGLVTSGMTDVTKIKGFLDVFGDWDISLMFVMIGALAVAAVSFPLILKREKPMDGDKFDVPTNTKISAPLVYGSILFGAGWALVGLCPGPAVTSLFYGHWQIWLFFVFMIAGHFIAKFIQKA